ncbi:hypothetical protein OZX67_05395 [Bifidobacterium sp. ESL0728]|uniref:hypothetical protein n=1 Tax=Bifidobacterium sp. ESL0728 TaxID=2983220 RepID=UPI0023F6CE01|nr:hypothetical protein [Bifidobacterium sp. ESL0728]WEV58274.1 hypothetical protein OZX67_05395 [Bifidobacterium sp. ESL0728]
MNEKFVLVIQAGHQQKDDSNNAKPNETIKYLFNTAFENGGKVTFKTNVQFGLVKFKKYKTKQVILTVRKNDGSHAALIGDVHFENGEPLADKNYSHTNPIVIQHQKEFPPAENFKTEEAAGWIALDNVTLVANFDATGYINDENPEKLKKLSDVLHTGFRHGYFYTI